MTLEEEDGLGGAHQLAEIQSWIFVTNNTENQRATAGDRVTAGEAVKSDIVKMMEFED